MKRLRLHFSVGVRRAAYAAFLVAVVAAAYYWREPLMRVWREQAWTMVMATGFMVTAIVIQARNFIAFLDSSDDVSVWPLSRVWALTSLANYLGPFQPGVALRIAYLSRHGVGWRESLLATWRQLCTSGWISLAGCGVGLLTLTAPYARLAGGTCIVVFVLVPMLRSMLRRSIGSAARPRWLVGKRDLLIDAISGIGLAGIVGVVMQYLVGTALLWFVYRAYGAPIHPGHALLLACMVYVSSLVALLPGNLGVLDAIYVFGGQGVGLSLPESAAMALMLRCAQVIAAAGLALAGPPPVRAASNPPGE
ncbi:Uncharacterized membrane protein YbhN, UPF0104 family [Luteibacter sp. UNC138MFCol5.1]|uniref:lysylphosphatidylglycerol synthase domain-containing protein n=1 Tax=Luteibacter sp. UNC138MFCol5.1 TaxID=1502774 RepID=UPI0008B2B475|nr:lysylphosphatidylglycerol synthase domain-containing protein [Luteibacter sp. UNC138MFCol5.1]SEO84653.1 Uncharacterized membrane protein YbhN, UPF0104 family [Luteibacter sp. UNC138MFCol5.1]